MPLAFTLHAFHPKALNDCYCFQAGLLAYPTRRPSRYKNSGMELRISRSYKSPAGITATGIAPESHRLPFSPRYYRGPGCGGKYTE